MVRRWVQLAGLEHRDPPFTWSDDELARLQTELDALRAVIAALPPADGPGATGSAAAPWVLPFPPSPPVPAEDTPAETGVLQPEER
jgi:hypothetical protein